MVDKNNQKQNFYDLEEIFSKEISVAKTVLTIEDNKNSNSIDKNQKFEEAMNIIIKTALFKDKNDTKKISEDLGTGIYVKYENNIVIMKTNEDFKNTTQADDKYEEIDYYDFLMKCIKEFIDDKKLDDIIDDENVSTTMKKSPKYRYSEIYLQIKIIDKLVNKYHNLVFLNDRFINDHGKRLDDDFEFEEKVEEKPTEDYATCFLKGNKFLTEVNKNYPEAINYFKKALIFTENKNEKDKLYVLIAQSALACKQFKLSEEYCNIILENDPSKDDRKIALCMLGQINYQIFNSNQVINKKYLEVAESFFY